MMMVGLVIFNICLWPWLAYWCLVVASLASQLLRSLSSSLSLIIMMMIDDDDDDNLFRSSSSPLSWMIMVMMMMMMTIMIIFSDLPHCLCPSAVVSCHWPLLPKMGWFVIVNLVIGKSFVFSHRTRGLHSTSWCWKYFSSFPSANANETEVLSKFLIDWLKHSTFRSVVSLAMFL